MPNFNAGAIEASLTLDRSPFTTGIRAARAQAKNLEDDGVTVKIDADTEKASKKVKDLDDDVRAMSREEKIQFDVDTAEAERQLRNFEKNQKLALDLDDKKVKEELRRLEKDAKIELKADLDAAKARAQIALLARNRRIQITANLVNFSRIQAQLRSLGKMTIALSGANVITNRLSAIRNQLENIDKIAYKMGGLTYLFGNLANLLLAAGANTWTFIGSLGALGGLLIPLPVLLGSIATAAGVMAIAFTGWSATGNDAVKSMQDIKGVLKELTPAWNDLLKTVRSAYWDGMADTFKTFATTLLPTFRKGLEATASEMSTFTKSLLQSLTNVPTGTYENIFAGIASSIKIAEGGIQPFVDAFATLGSIGSDNLDRFAQAITSGLTRFNEFIQTAANNGDLQAWIDNAATAFGDLMRVLGQLGGIFNGFAEGLKAAGTTTLSTLADTLTRIHDIVDTPVFQYGLSTIFTGVMAGVDGLSQALGPIGDMLAGMAPTIAHLASQIGLVLGGALTAIAGAINTPAFQTGLTAFFDGLATGVLGIAPYLPQIAAGFGAIGEVAGAILANVGPALGALLAGLGDILVELAPSLLILVDALGGALMDAIVRIVPALEPLVLAIGDLVVALSPVIVTVVQAIVDALVALAPAVTDIVLALVPFIQAFAQIAPLIAGSVVVIIQLLAEALITLAPTIKTVADMFLQVFTAISPLIPQILALFQNMLPLATSMFPIFVALLPQISSLFTEMLNAIVPIIPDLLDLFDAFNQLAIALLPIIMQLVPVFIALLQAAMPFVTAFTQMLITGLAVAMRIVSVAIQEVTRFLTALAAGFRASLDGVRETAHSMVEIFTGIKDKVTGAFSGAKDWLKDAAARIISGFTEGIRSAFGKVRETFNSLTDMIPDWKGPASRDRVLLKPNANLIMGGLVKGLEENRSALKRKLGDITNDIKISGTVGTGTQSPGFPGYPSPPTAGAASAPAGTVVQTGAIQVKVEVPNGMNEDQVGTHVAAKLGQLLSTGTIPALKPVVG